MSFTVVTNALSSGLENQMKYTWKLEEIFMPVDIYVTIMTPKANILIKETLEAL